MQPLKSGSNNWMHRITFDTLLTLAVDISETVQHKCSVTIEH